MGHCFIEAIRSITHPPVRSSMASLPEILKMTRGVAQSRSALPAAEKELK